MSECILYGIPNCDKVRAARKWLDAHQLPYRFHNLRQDGIDIESLLQRWLQQVSLNDLINKRSATWRQLTITEKKTLEAAVDLSPLYQHPTLLKRPILEQHKTLLIGFNADHWQDELL